jgi:flagellar basal-body rod protein FlgB
MIRGQIDLMTRLLDVASLRHDVIAANVANINTPGYRQRQVVFEDELAKALQQPGGAPLKVAAKVVESERTPDRADGNNVDIDVEMADLNKNTLLYRTLAQLLTTHIASMRSAISGR